MSQAAEIEQMSDTVELVNRWQQGDQDAAATLFDLYASRLIALVRVRLGDKMRQRFDADDVIQSAFRSFFIGTREGRYLLSHSGDVWRLLVAIAIHKLQHRVTRNLAMKRTVNADVSFDESVTTQLAQPPAAVEAILVADEIERIHGRLPVTEQRIFELRLEGYSLDEIAADTGRSQRTVRRVLARVKKELRLRWEA